GFMMSDRLLQNAQSVGRRAQGIRDFSIQERPTIGDRVKRTSEVLGIVLRPGPPEGFLFVTRDVVAYGGALLRRLATAVLLALGTSLGCAHIAVDSTTAKPAGAADARLQAIRRAQVWSPTDVSSMNLMAGPAGPRSFAPDERVSCDYLAKGLGGHSPKFACVIAPDDELKVKFGRSNGEVYAEVAASRLFWALGFYAERMYPVRIDCHGCPSSIHGTE